MSFSKFKLSKSGQRTAPVPIAAALPQSPTLGNNCAQHESPEYKRPRVMDRKESSISTSSPVISAGREVQHESTPYMAPSSSGKEGGPRLHGPEFISETQAPAAFSTGVDGTGICHGSLIDAAHSRLIPWRRKLDTMLNHFVGPGLAEQIFHQYINNLVPTCPVVIFPPDTTAGYLRKTKPLLFMAIMSVAPVGLCTPDQHKQFSLEARGFLAEVAILEGEKSLELVQALLIVSFWYRAPENYARTNQNQLASIALSIAIDIGLDRIAEPRAPKSIDDKWNRAEAQRTWLGCFLLCASLSLIMRRPNPTFWTSQLKEYLDDVKQSKTVPTDEFFCKLLTMEHVCYIADQKLSLSDPSKSVRLWGPNTLSTIEDLQGLVDGLGLDQHNPVEKALLEFGRQAILLYAHELALHVNHNIDEFKAPFSTRSLKSYSFIDLQAPNTAYLSIIRTIILAAQGLLDTFNGLSISEMLSLPPHIYAGRVIYAVILLMKLHKALSAPMCKLNDDISVGQLRLEAYIERLLLISKRLSAEDPRSSLSRAFLIMPQLKEWLQSTLENREQSLEKGIRAESCASPVPASINQTELPQSLQVDADRQISDTLGALGNAGDNWNRELASDSWFWEFFNVDMLH